MANQFEFCGEMVDIPDYEPQHYFENQKEWAAEGIPLNPNLRDGFDFTPHDYRDQLEIEHWWGKPFIVTEEYCATDDSYEAHIARSKEWGFSPIVNSEQEWEIHQKESKANWLSVWPSGTRFEARSLSGGAWDRSSSLGMFKTIEEAIDVAQRKSGCVWEFR